MDRSEVPLWRVSEHEALSETAWASDRARATIAEIVADAETARNGCVWPAHPLDEDGDDLGPWTSLYLGTAGVVWALHHLGSSLDLRSLMAEALARYRSAPDLGEMAHASSLWLGETGLLAVASIVGADAYDPDRLRELIVSNEGHPTRELMWGSPGTILAARCVGLDGLAEASCKILYKQWDTTTDLWTQELYGHVEQLLGPAHGFAANVHVLRGHATDAELRRRVRSALEPLALHADGLVNWPPATRPRDDLAEKIRVQWCHGAPGIIATIGDLLPKDLAIAAGELVWRAGPLRKGANLCHGTAGNGYAFLRLYELTADDRWLDRAQRFAMHAADQVAASRAVYGRGRYSLWTGDLGTAIYLRSCLRADAAFPTVDFW